MHFYAQLNTLLLFVTCISLNCGEFALAESGEKDGMQGEVIFFDDFSAPELDRSKWNVVLMPKPYNREQQAYVDSAETLYVANGEEALDASAGVLVLHPRFKPNFEAAEDRVVDFTSSRINTKGKVEFTYGTAAARIKLTEGSGIWPAFWLLGNGRWPATGEIDIMEYVGETDWIGVALHGPGYSGKNAFVNQAYFTDKADVTHWHIYSVEWSKEQIVFKVDGRKVYRATRTMVERRGEWAYDTPKFLILNVALGGDYPVKSNDIKLPYLGIPESTVQRIQDNQSKMLVDWVRVTQGN